MRVRDREYSQCSRRVSFAPACEVCACMCDQMYQYVIHVTAHASVYTLVLMSLDRYLAVVHPIRSLTIRTRRNAVVSLVLLWTVVIAANSPMLQQFSVGCVRV